MKPELSVVIPTDRFETIDQLVASLAAPDGAGIDRAGGGGTGCRRPRGSRGGAGRVPCRASDRGRDRLSAARAGGWDPGGERRGRRVRRVALVSRARVGRGLDRRPPGTVGGGRARDGQPPHRGQHGLGQVPGRLRPVGTRRSPKDRSRTCRGTTAPTSGTVLLEYGTELEHLLDAEWLLHKNLRSRGHRLYLEPAAMSRHFSVTRLVPSIIEWFHFSRAFATSRSRDWRARTAVALHARLPVDRACATAAGDRGDAPHRPEPIHPENAAGGVDDSRGKRRG